MLDRDSLKTLAAARSDRGVFVSAFVSTSRLDDWRQTAPTFLNSESTRVVKELDLDKESRRHVQEDVDRILEVLRYEVDPRIEGLAVFADGESGRFERFELPFRLQNRLVVGPTAYLRPLIHALSLLEPFILVRVSRDESTVYSIDEWRVTGAEEHSGPYLKSTDRETGDVPVKEYYAAARQETLVDLHFKDVSAAVDRTLDDTGAAHIVLLGQHEVVAHFRKTLSARAAALVDAEVALDTVASFPQLLVGARAALESARKAAMESIAHRISEGLGSGGRGVAGFEDTLAALRRGQVQTLLIDREYRPSGWRCAACEHVVLAPLETCPVCGGAIVPVADAVGEAVHTAVLQGTFVEVAEQVPELGAMGGIGGLLRYG